MSCLKRAYMPLLFGALVLPRVAWPADPTTPEEIEARGRELFENGAILYDEGRYEDAILAWQEGYRISARSGFLFNIANAQERLGLYAEAIDTLGRYRALAKAEERETLDRRIRNLEERLAASPPPQPPQPAPGKVRTEQGGSSALRPALGLGLTSLGVAGLTTGVVFGLQAKAAGREATALCQQAENGLLCPVQADPLIAANHRRALVSDISFGVGALSSVGGVVLLLTGPKDPAKRVTWVPTGSGLAVCVKLP